MAPGRLGVAASGRLNCLVSSVVVRVGADRLSGELARFGGHGRSVVGEVMEPRIILVWEASSARLAAAWTVFGDQIVVAG